MTADDLTASGPLDGGQVAIIPGRDAHKLARILAGAAREAMTAGRRLSPADLRLLQVLRQVGDRWAISDIGNAEVVDARSMPAWAHDHDSCTVTEAAGLLGVTDRRVRQLCANGHLDSWQPRPAGPWLLSRTSVLDHLTDRHPDGHQ